MFPASELLANAPALSSENNAIGSLIVNLPIFSSETRPNLPVVSPPAPAPPGDWYADHVYPKAEMDRARHEMMKENGGQTIAFLSLDRAEYQARKGRDGYRWGAEGWYGGDIDRVTRQLSDLIAQISTQASSEARSANVVAANIQHIFAVTEQTGEGTRSTAQMVRELSKTAEELKQSVARFKIA